MIETNGQGVSWAQIAAAALLTWLCVAAIGGLLTEIVFPDPAPRDWPHLSRYAYVIPTFLMWSTAITWPILIVMIPVMKYLSRPHYPSVLMCSLMGIVLGGTLSFFVFGLGYATMGAILGAIYGSINWLVLRGIQKRLPPYIVG